MRSRTIITAAATLAATVAPAGCALAQRAASKGFVDGVDNRYFPLAQGSQWVYQGVEDGEPSRDVVTVTDKTIVIKGVRCTVVHDEVFESGHLEETTDDYYAQDKRGTVWYFGEDTKELDSHGNVVSTEGSWKAGVDGAREGIQMESHPRVGDAYQQEFYAGHAEDRAKILDLKAPVSVPFGTFKHTLRTKEWTRLEPGIVDNKYYAKGIGEVKELTVKGASDHQELVSFTRGDDR
jgi:hypothetical protein